MTDSVRSRGTVVVRWATSAAIADPAVPLTDGERARLAGLASAADREAFLAVRTLVRRVVADRCGVAPERVTLVQTCPSCGGPHGRPSVSVAGRPGPEVSLSHAGGLAVVAVAGLPVGVDVEPEAPDTGQRPDTGDLRRWVRTEAVLKATGLGLDVDPRLLAVSDPGPGRAPRLVAWSGPGRRPVLRIADVGAVAGHVIAVARRGRWPIRLDAAPLGG